MEKQKLSFAELEENKSWKEAVVVFSPESWDSRKEYTEVERSYQISSDAKYFNPDMIGNSLFGDCLDGKDNGVRLDWYMNLLPTEGRRWIVEYCYIVE